MSDVKVRISGLYKIFGSDPEAALGLVKQGVGKQELLDSYGAVLGLNDINIDIPPRKLQVIMGLSGSGKSTLIRHINRLIEPTAGEILVDGEDVMGMNAAALREFRRHKVSMVFQKFGLFPHRTVAQNVAYGLSVQGIPEAEAAERSTRWLERVGLGGFDNRYPSQLSGGMQQRVGLARALATDADILLMDEAFSALDPLIRTDMQDILLDLQRELHKTIIFITHDLDEALRIGDRIAILRDGSVIQQGRPQEIVMKPADDYIADFTKDINRARVLTVSAAMSPGAGAGGPGLPGSLTLEDALPRLVEMPGGAADVLDEDGQVAGRIDIPAAVAAMARPEAAAREGGAYR